MLQSQVSPSRSFPIIGLEVQGCNIELVQLVARFKSCRLLEVCRGRTRPIQPYVKLARKYMKSRNITGDNLQLGQCSGGEHVRRPLRVKRNARQLEFVARGGT